MPGTFLFGSSCRLGMIVARCAGAVNAAKALRVGKFPPGGTIERYAEVTPESLSATRRLTANTGLAALSLTLGVRILPLPISGGVMSAGLAFFTFTVTLGNSLATWSLS